MTAPSVADPMSVRSETAADARALEAVVAEAFGPGRFAKTAERLREGRRPRAGFVAADEDGLLGGVRLWSIDVGDRPALFLGPIAVRAEARRDGLGARLVEACLEWEDPRGGDGVLLVGDLGYFGRFGFRRTTGVLMPGPVDPARLLWRPARATAPEPAGRVVPDLSVDRAAP